MSDITIGETRKWEGETFTFVLTRNTGDFPNHCVGCDEDFIGERNIWRRGDNYFVWCKSCHDIVVASGPVQGVRRG